MGPVFSDPGPVSGVRGQPRIGQRPRQQPAPLVASLGGQPAGGVGNCAAGFDERPAPRLGRQSEGRLPLRSHRAGRPVRLEIDLRPPRPRPFFHGPQQHCLQPGAPVAQVAERREGRVAVQTVGDDRDAGRQGQAQPVVRLGRHERIVRQGNDHRVGPAELGGSTLGGPVHVAGGDREAIEQLLEHRAVVAADHQLERPYAIRLRQRLADQQQVRHPRGRVGRGVPAEPQQPRGLIRR